jgi:hypothetical protein
VQALHFEFEGSGIKDVLEWASAILALLVAALAVLLLLGPYGAILSVILWIIAAILTAIGGVTTLFDPLDPGDPTDVDQSLASLKKGDIVVVKGNWTYDSLHIGWNEIHAVHDCMIVNEIATDADGNRVSASRGVSTDPEAGIRSTLVGAEVGQYETPGQRRGAWWQRYSLPRKRAWEWRQGRPLWAEALAAERSRPFSSRKPP